ncbi:MAG TPA: Uma2 family endonuclease [Ktedonosporobacter sp.]|nr:Uma2 family endonuclease [Ktedonosporobacter sp.]
MEQHERQQEMRAIEHPQGMISADWVPGPSQGEWTYEDYAKLDDEQRYEIVNGVLLMAPALNLWHQRIATKIAMYLGIYVDEPGHGHVYQGPDVRLAQEVFQPDVVVVLNKHFSKEMKQVVNGAPDLAIEVASPGTASYDQITKYHRYARAGVSEYWMVNPQKRAIEVLVLEGSAYHSLRTFSGKDTLPSRIVPDLPVRVEQFFPEW